MIFGLNLSSCLEKNASKCNRSMETKGKTISSTIYFRMVSATGVFFNFNYVDIFSLISVGFSRESLYYDSGLIFTVENK